MNLNINRAYLACPSPDMARLAYGLNEIWEGPIDGPYRQIAEGAAFAGWYELGGVSWVPTGSFFVTNPETGVYERDLRYYAGPVRGWHSFGFQTSQQPGSFPQIACKGSYVISSILGQHFVNGVPIPTDPHAGHIEDFVVTETGVEIAYKLQEGDPWTLIVTEVAQ